jgi:hypothetical protein
MKTQLIQDHNGKPTGVFIPIKDWEIIKNEYPNIEAINHELEMWEQEFIDHRIAAIEKNPERLKPIDDLFEQLKSKE